MHYGEDVGEASLSSPLKNVGEDTLPSSPAILASSPVLDTGGAAVATATIDVQIEEGEIVTMASQETVGPSSQRFVAETPQETAGDVGANVDVASPPQLKCKIVIWEVAMWKLMFKKLRLMRVTVLPLLPLTLMSLMKMSLMKKLSVLGFLV